MFTNVKISEEINDTFITLGWVEGFSKVRYKYQLEEKKHMPMEKWSEGKHVIHRGKMKKTNKKGAKPLQ